jgi:hypothetical protein
MYKNVYEYLSKDISNIYQLDGNIQVYIEPWEIQDLMKEKKQGACYFFHPHLSFSNEHGCAIERSNLRLFLRKFKKSRFVKHIKGAFDYEAIAIDILCTHKKIIEWLINLDNDPVTDMRDYSKMEQQLEKTAWRNWIKRDFTKALEKKFNADDSNPNKNKLWQLYCQLKKESDSPAEIGRGGSILINIDQLLQHLHKPPAFLKLKYGNAA